ncbi:MAG: response regulator [Leptolyngbya sp. SIO4C5]|nr:response regulator [Leptolyngbya sp. SIO4C5]
MRLWQTSSFTTRVASAFLLLSLLSVAGVGGIAFVRARTALERAAYDRLSVAATLKEQEIARWFEACERDFLMIRQFPDIQKNLQQILTHQPDSPAYEQAYADLQRYFNEYAHIKPKFAEIFLLDRSNRIILSTNQSHEGQYEIATNLTYFETVQPGEAFTPVFYISGKTGKPAITYAAPIRDGNGQRQGVILADLNLGRIDQIISERTGLGETGETYVVGSLSNRNSFISKATADAQELENLSSQGINQAMQGISGADLYLNYVKVPVIGVYRWLDSQNIALLVEMSQEEALSSPARQLAFTIMIVGLGSAGILLAGVSQLARQLKRSREQLEDYSHQLEKKAEEASTANQAKSQFLANMSHELRTPLNAILGFSQLMTRDPSIDEAQLENLSIISRSGEHLLTLIDDVLSMSKIEAGLTTLHLTSFDFYSLLESLEIMLRVKADAQGLQLVFQRSPDVPRYVKTDEGKLRQVLINLIGNAIKFTPKGQVELRVSCVESRSAQADEADRAIEEERATQASHKQGRPTHHLPLTTHRSSPPLLTRCRLHFEVADTGPGIAAEELAELFNPFVQTATGQKSQQGTGLGLSISRSFVRLMGGDITVNSVLAQGSVFAFDIDTCLAQTAEVQQRSPHRRMIGLAPNQPAYRLLIVEDRWENRQLLLKMLQPLGFETCEAVNGQEGLDLWAIWQPHLIWMDMRMPVLDGYQATRQIREIEQQTDRPHTRIIAITASAFEEQQTQIFEAGCDDFVRKPFREEVIFNKLAQHLGVQFVYESSLPASPLSPPAIAAPSVTLIAQQLAEMPQSWIDKLHAAAVSVDADWINQLAAQIPDDCADLAQQLNDLLHRFDFDTLIELTQAKADASVLHEHSQS